MKKQKRMWILLLLSFILIIFISGCGGVIVPKTAKINISFSPNPVPYSNESGEWIFNLILSEINGVGVTLISLRFDAYNQEEELYYTQILYEEEIINWFDSNYLPAFSSLQAIIYHTSIELKYDILIVVGVDDNDNPIEATDRVDYLPK
jgi:flagellar basal body-associated protein FliL